MPGPGLVIILGALSFGSPHGPPLQRVSRLRLSSGRLTRATPAACEPTVPAEPTASAEPTAPAAERALAERFEFKEAPLRVYSEEAISLFNNMRLPAAIIAGSILPLGFGFPLRVGADPIVFSLCVRSHLMIAVASLAAELVAIVYSTVAVNKLTECEHTMPATRGVLPLLMDYYEEAWLGCNCCFFLGLFGAASMIGLRALLEFRTFGVAPALLMAAAVALMCASVNEGIAQGDGSGDSPLRFSPPSLGGLTYRYLYLLGKNASEKQSFMLTMGTACSILGWVLASGELMRTAVTGEIN